MVCLPPREGLNPQHPPKTMTRNAHDPNASLETTAGELRELLDRVSAKVERDAFVPAREKRATWPAVGSANHARTLLVEALFALGGIDEDEAASRFAVTL